MASLPTEELELLRLNSLSAQQEQVTTLLTLPEHLVGYIFSMLPRGQDQRADRRALFTCCKTLHGAKSIHAQFSELTIYAHQLHISRSNPFLCFPSGARLRKMVLESLLMERAPYSGHLLAQFLQPTNADAQLKVMSALKDLEEIHFVDFPLDEEDAEEVGTLLSHNSCLRTVAVKDLSYFTGAFAPFFMAFTTPGCKRGLEVITYNMKHFFDEEGPARQPIRTIEAISKLESLQALTLLLPGFEEDPEMVQRFAPIGSLTQLRSLTIEDERYSHIMHRSQQQDLSKIVEQMRSLQYLQMPQLPRGPVLAALPETIEHIVVRQGCDDADDFCISLTGIASRIDHLPNLRTIDVDWFKFGEGWNGDCSGLSHAVSALSHLHIGLKNINCTSSFDGLLSFLSHTKAIAKSVMVVNLLISDPASASAANYKQLGELCPNLTCLNGIFMLEYLENLFEAHHLSSLKELYLEFNLSPKPGEVGGIAHKLLGLAVAMSAKKAPPLEIKIVYERYGLSQQELLCISREIDQLERLCSSTNQALRQLSCEFCEVRVQFFAVGPL
ncbi:hypothetical protein DUNSADRAFT_9264 [Dunaliella salina]|uniref:F-box domain-containing protein n=1 Tax=Dunaliella salina TaxID=3046 RepID=A0ABQ7GHR6_DUNSA|nr:hypothetical protein DUNSADRAFT_9264 [Dunaliella salina]|eukprot:KAF5834145.1 hypothetical protein DUNSADRAFT_9264 [Dunaliella salina]